ncbi:hypothetical protein T4E_7036, partial [Trichinella pseudospiralis]
LTRSLIHLRQHRFGDIHHRGGRRYGSDVIGECEASVKFPCVVIPEL